MERMTNDKTAQELKRNNDKLTAAGIAVDSSGERYVRLAEYEATGLTPEQIEELIDKHWEECRQIALYDDELFAEHHYCKCAK